MVKYAALTVVETCQLEINKPYYWEIIHSENKCFCIFHGNGFLVKCMKRKQTASSLCCQAGHTAFSSMLWRVVFKQLLEHLASGFQFNSIILPVVTFLSKLVSWQVLHN